MLQKLYFLIFFNFAVVTSSDDYILDFVYVDSPTTVTTTMIAETTTEVTTTEVTTTEVTTTEKIATSTSKTDFSKSNVGTSLYDPREFNKDQFTKIEVDFETQFEAKRREKDRYENTSDTDNSEASGSQREVGPSEFEIIKPLNVPLVSRNDRQNSAIGKKNAAADLEKINESFQQAFDQMFDTDTKVTPKNLKKVRKTQT